MDSLKPTWQPKVDLSQANWPLYWDIFRKHFLHLILAASTGLFSAMFMLAAVYLPDIKQTQPNFPTNTFFAVVVLLLLSLSIAGPILKHRSWTPRLLAMGQSWLVYFFTLGYFLSVDIMVFKLLVVCFATLLISVSNYYLFSAKHYPFSLLLLLVILYNVQSFSLITILQEQKAIWTGFDLPLINNPIFTSELFWLFTTITAITYTTMRHLITEKTVSSIIYASLYFYILGQVLLLIHIFSPNGFFYWHKTIVSVVVWDFLYMPFSVMIKKIADGNYSSRILVYAGYHGILLGIIFLISLLFT
jgi:hypothetical protein